MMKREILLLLMASILCTIFLISCKNSETHKVLLRLESRIFQKPDSVYSVLQGMNERNFSDDESTLYALLNLVYADISNKLPDSDSIINTIIEYYEHETDNERLFLTYSLKGKILFNKHYYLPASDCFQKAELHLSYCKDNYAKFLLYSQMAHIYHFKDMRDDECEAVKKELCYADSLGNNRCKIRALKDYSIYYHGIGDVSHAISLLKHAFFISDDNELTKMKLCHDIARLYLEEQNPDSALCFVNLAPGLLDNEIYHEVENLKARAFALKKMSDSAEYYYNKSIAKLDLPCKVAALYDLYNIKYNQSLNKEAFDFLRMHVVYRDSLDALLKEKRIERLIDIQEYKKQKVLAANTKMELVHNKVLFYRVFVFMLIVLIGVLCRLYVVKRRERNLEREKLDVQQQILQSQLEKQETETLLMHEQQKRERVENQQLLLKIDYYKRLNDITIPILLKSRNRQGALHMNDDDWNIIINNTDSCFDHFTVRLNKSFPQLNKDDLYFCCLIKMEMNMDFLASIYHVAKGSISRKKMRLKEKMQINNTSFDEFIEAF